MLDTLSKNTLVPLILRLMLAAIFIYHGMGKISGENNEVGMNWMKTPDGKPDPNAQPGMVQLLVAWGELIGGIAMLLGFLTRIAALGLIAIMAGAIYLVHLPKGFSLQQGGYEYALTILSMCVCLVLLGGGTLSVDRFVFRRRYPPPI